MVNGVVDVDYTHPRKGTETSTPASCLTHTRRLYSSPQGDGNRRHVSTAGREMEIILIPARGRKRLVLVTSSADTTDYTHPRKGTETKTVVAIPCAITDYTHPRKGTETSRFPCSFGEYQRLYSSPQGDGNLLTNNLICGIIRDYTHPRKGTETYPGYSCPPKTHDYTHPRKGTETAEPRTVNIKFN